MEALANALKTSAISQNAPATLADNTVSVSADVSADVSKDNSCINNNHVEIMFEDRIFKTSWDTLSKSAYFMNIGRLKRDNGQSANKFTIFNKSSDNFAHILNYLRDSRYVVPENLYYEFDYYMIDPPEIKAPEPVKLVIPDTLDESLFEIVEISKLKAHDGIAEVLILTSIDNYNEYDYTKISLNMQTVIANITKNIYYHRSDEIYFCRDLLFNNVDYYYTYRYNDLLKNYIYLTYKKMSGNKFMWKYPLIPKHKYAIIKNKLIDTQNRFDTFDTSIEKFTKHINNLFNSQNNSKIYTNNVFIKRLKSPPVDAVLSFTSDDYSGQWLYWQLFAHGEYFLGKNRNNVPQINYNQNKSADENESADITENIFAHIYYICDNIDYQDACKYGFICILHDNENDQLNKKQFDEQKIKLKIYDIYDNEFHNNTSDDNIWYFNNKFAKKYKIFGYHKHYYDKCVYMSNLKLNLFALISAHDS